MKRHSFKLLFAISILFLSLTGYAQAPQSFSYQAVARDVNGNLLASTNISLRFSIHDGTAGGTIVYRETQSATSNTLGLVNVNIGQGTVVTGTFSTIAWGTGAKYLEVEIDPAGGSSYTSLGTSQLLSVPYALYAQNGGGTASNADVVQVNGTNSIFLQDQVTNNWTALPGLSTSVNVGTGDKLVISTTGGIYTHTLNTATVAIGLQVFIDNVGVPETFQLGITSEPLGYEDGLSYWAINYAATNLTPGNHTIEVRAKFGNSSDNDIWGATISGPSGDLGQGHLIVTTVK